MADLPRYEKWALLLTAGFVLFTGGWFLAGHSSPEPYTITAARPDGSVPLQPDGSRSDEGGRPDSLLEGEIIDLNTAAPEDLERLPGIGPAKAEAIAAFLHQTGMTQEAVAAQLGMSPSALANKLRLLRLSPACRALLVEHGLTERHARCLLRLEDEGERLTALRQAAAKHWNVAQTEQYVERRLAALQTAPPAGRRTYIIKDVRLFLNSVDRGLRLIRDAGVDARTEREETEDEIVLTLRIPKQRRKEA